MKPRQVLALKADGTLSVLHLSQDGAAASQFYQNLNHSDGRGYAEVALLGPWGIEKHRKFQPISTAEIKPVAAVRVKK